MEDKLKINFIKSCLLCLSPTTLPSAKNTHALSGYLSGNSGAIEDENVSLKSRGNYGPSRYSRTEPMAQDTSADTIQDGRLNKINENQYLFLLPFCVFISFIFLTIFIIWIC